MSTKTEIYEIFAQLPDDKQKIVLEFSRSLLGSENNISNKENELPPGIMGKEFVKTSKGLFTPEEADELAQIIEDGCEK